ncbi:MAG: hypothetical protein L0387_28325 [Acidobacteria bacterium]|nr:hypothetical protein [Acidobacteriota bacterium]MCI0721058.1 hypothetical protein [Acidobacteriota bacterium]
MPASFLHVFFPKRLRWNEELQRLSLLNRQIFWVHCLFIVLILILFGMLSFVFAPALLQPHPLSKAILSGFVLFWLLRLIVQLCVYDSSLWKGNGRNTTIHFLLAGLWSYLVVIYGTALCRQPWR